MKYVFYVFVVLVIGAVGSGIYWYTTENEKAERTEQYRRDQIRLAKEEAQREKDRAEDERIRKERMAEVAKDDAVKLFLRYLDREESRLKTEVEETKIQLQKIGIDHESLSDELKAIERANAARVASSRKRGEKQRDKVERVSAILRSPVINRLASTYCGEDLSALRSEFEAAIQKIKDIDDVTLKKLQKNMQVYEDEVKGVDKEVDEKTANAQRQTERARRSAQESIPELEKKLADVNKKLRGLEEKDLKARSGGAHLTPWERRDLERYQAHRDDLEEILRSRKNIADIGNANAAHIEATLAETRARRRYDSAEKRVREANDMILKENSYELAIYGAARDFEARSLDQVRAAMKTRIVVDGKRLADAEEKIRFLREASANMDFLNAAEVEAMRKKVASRLSENIANEVLK